MRIIIGAFILISVTSMAPAGHAETRTVFLGGVGGNFCSGMADRAALRRTTASGKIGRYEHANGMAACTPVQRRAIWDVWERTPVTSAGQRHTVAEIGGSQEVEASSPSFMGYFSYFGGVYPSEANMNILRAHSESH